MLAARSDRIARMSTAALGAAVLCVALTSNFARAQSAPGPSSSDIPSVGVTPTESHDGDPNRGQWFVFNLEPGRTATTKARIGNPAKVAQTVSLYFRDLTFGTDGTPSIKAGAQDDIGAWGHFDHESVTLAPNAFVQESFHINVPAGAEPGDHVGVLVAESAPSGDLVKIVKRLATRVYVTVPGEATKSFRIEKLSHSTDSTWWPSRIDATVTVRNTGRIRLHPIVTVARTKAKGADPLLARSVETYAAPVRVPWYGGPVNLAVKVSTDAGITHQISTSVFVIPWGLLAMIPVVLLVALALRFLWRLRTAKLRRLQSDLRRLEQMVAKRPDGVVPPPPESDDTDLDDSDEGDAARVGSIRAGLKRARRGQSRESFERLALSLHDTGEDALDELVEALGAESPLNRAALVAAVASYGAPRLAGHADLGGLPDDIGAEIARAGGRGTDRPGPKPARGPRAVPAPARNAARAPRTRKPEAAKRASRRDDD